MSFTSQLLRFLRRAGTERSTARVIAEMLQFVGEAFTIRRISLHLAETGTGRLVPYVSQFASGEERPELYRDWRGFDIEDTDLVRRVRAGEDAILVDDAADGLLPRAFVETFDVEPYLAVALRRGGHVAGLLILEGPLDTLRQRQEEAVEFADYLALALENARAFEREQERTGEAQALIEVADVLSRTTELVPVLAAVTRQCAKVTGFERGSIFLVDPETNRLVPTMSQFADGHPDPDAWARFHSTESDLPIAWEVIRSGEPAAFEDPDEHPDLIPDAWLRPFGIETIVYLPLSAWGQRFGVLVLDHRERTPISDRQLRIARAVAAQGSVAIGVIHALSRERAAVGELERANRLKDEVLSMVSHEMRSPLTAILGYGELLERKADRLDPDQRREMAGRIQANADRQLQLIDALLSSDRLASGTMLVDRRHTSLCDVVADAVGGVDLAGTTVSVEVDEQHDVLADASHVRQIVTNLLTNAMRYGRPPFEISSEADPDAGTVELRIRDRGVGVPESFVPRLFDRFTQVAPNGQTPGVGLGLSIARQMAQANDGDLAYEPGDPGACFVVTLPLFGAGHP